MPTADRVQPSPLSGQGQKPRRPTDTVPRRTGAHFRRSARDSKARSNAPSTQFSRAEEGPKYRRAWVVSTSQNAPRFGSTTAAALRKPMLQTTSALRHPNRSISRQTYRASNKSRPVRRTLDVRSRSAPMRESKVVLQATPVAPKPCEQLRFQQDAGLDRSGQDIHLPGARPGQRVCPVRGSTDAPTSGRLLAPAGR